MQISIFLIPYNFCLKKVEWAVLKPYIRKSQNPQNKVSKSQEKNVLKPPKKKVSKPWHTCHFETAILGLLKTAEIRSFKTFFSSLYVTNKAGYTASPVACGWAGPIFEVTSSFGQVQWGQRPQKSEKSKVWRTDRRTDRWTDRRRAAAPLTTSHPHTLT